MGTKKAMLLFFPPPHLTTEIRVEQIHDLHSCYVSIHGIKVSELFKELNEEIWAMNSDIPFAVRSAVRLNMGKQQPALSFIYIYIFEDPLQITTCTFKQSNKSACWDVLFLDASILIHLIHLP